MKGQEVAFRAQRLVHPLRGGEMKSVEMHADRRAAGDPARQMPREEFRGNLQRLVDDRSLAVCFNKHDAPREPAARLLLRTAGINVSPLQLLKRPEAVGIAAKMCHDLDIEVERRTKTCRERRYVCRWSAQHLLDPPRRRAIPRIRNPVDPHHVVDGEVADGDQPWSVRDVAALRPRPMRNQRPCEAVGLIVERIDRFQHGLARRLRHRLRACNHMRHRPDGYSGHARHVADRRAPAGPVRLSS